MAASQPGFMHLKSSSDPATLISSRRKRVNKNKKKNWNKYSDINDVEGFLEDIRHQERTTGYVSLAACRRKVEHHDYFFTYLRFVVLGKSHSPRDINTEWRGQAL